MTRKTNKAPVTWTTASGAVISEDDAERLAAEFEQDDAVLDHGRVRFPRMAGRPSLTGRSAVSPQAPSASRPSCGQKLKSSRPSAARPSPVSPARRLRKCSGVALEIAITHRGRSPIRRSRPCGYRSPQPSRPCRRVLRRRP